MNIINSIKAHLYERSTSPLAGAFVFSWLGWNYHFVMVLFSDLKLDDKFTRITILYPNIWDGFWSSGFLYPFLTAVLVILLYPLPAIPLYSYSRLAQMIQRKLRQKIEEQKLLSVEESHAFIIENLNLQEDFSKQIKRKDGEIEALEAEIERLNTPTEPKGPLAEQRERMKQDEETFNKAFAEVTAQDSAQDKEADKDGLSDTEIKILKYLAEIDPVGASKIAIINRMVNQGEVNEDASYYLGEVFENGYATETRTKISPGKYEMRYYIAQAGRAEMQKFKKRKKSSGGDI